MKTCKRCSVDISDRHPGAEYCKTCLRARKTEQQKAYSKTSKGLLANAKYRESPKGRATVRRSVEKQIALGRDPFAGRDLDTPSRVRYEDDASISFDVGIDDLSGYGDDR